jgi:glucose-1-phosphate adenylyltransferase
MTAALSHHAQVTALVLGGGRGTRLYPLTRYRSKPAVPLAGKYRLVDVPISNCIHSGIRHIYVLTQFNSASLNRHIGRTYKFDSFSDGFVEILAAEQTPETESWFQGTADAVRKTLVHIADQKTTHILILSGDALYRQDYCELLEEHREHNAEITVCCKLVPENQASSFGIVGINSAGRVTSFHEKPKGDALPPLRVDPSTLKAAGLDASAASRPYLASMGIYLFNKEALFRALEDETSEDFGKQIIPRAISGGRVHAHLFDGYWEDIGTIGSFFQANLDLLPDNPQFSFYDNECPIFTHPRLLPSSEIVESKIERAMIAEGCLIRNARIRNSIVGIRSLIGEGSDLENVVMMGADYYVTNCQGTDPCATSPGVGRNVTARNCIIDKNARIGDGAKILNEKKLTEADGDCYVIRDGIVIIPKGAVVPPGTVI